MTNSPATISAEMRNVTFMPTLSAMARPIPGATAEPITMPRPKYPMPSPIRVFGMKCVASAIWQVPARANPTPLMIRKKISSGTYVVMVNPRRPIPIRTVLHFRSVTLLNRSAISPLKGRHTSEVSDTRPTINPAIVTVVPIPTRYFERIVAII